MDELTSPPLILLGAGGHARVLLSMSRSLKRTIVGVCDPCLARAGETYWNGLRVLGDDSVLDQYDRASVELINGLGQTTHNHLRRTLHGMMKSKGFRFATLVHPTAWRDPTVLLGEGVQVMAGAIIQVNVVIGDSTIINTRASVDHDCKISAHVHIAPGATLCGGVEVEEGAFIGSGATIIPGRHIGTEALVGAGTTVAKDLKSRQRLIGFRTS